ncbi:MAG: hypothetical protein AAGA54_26760 [Myxococcota bacterium]
MAEDPTPLRPVSVPAVFIIAAVMLGGAWFFLVEYAEVGWTHLQRGLLTSESALGFYAGIVSGVAAVVTVLAYPRRLFVVDEGLLVIRGLLRRRHTVPVVTIRTLEVEMRRSRKDHVTYTSYGVYVVRHAESRLEIHRFGDRKQARALADACAARWGLPPLD